MAANHPALPAGLELARYRVESLLARGGMSEVYVAHDNVLGRRVALKVLRDGERVQRFIREAEAASSLNHPAIVAVYDSGSATIDGDPVQFIAMELIEGMTLAAWARSTRSGRRKLEAMAGVADGLARAHAHGIVHRDLKPDNIMIARGGYPKILDFGIAKLTAINDGDTAPDSLLGTAAYMSPEQAERRAVDHHSDVFSFGAVLYEVLTGRAAFRRSTTVDTLHAIAHETPRLDDLDPSVARILRRCLAKTPEDRYDSMHDVALDLREAARDEVQPQARLRRLAILLTLLVLTGGFAAATLWRPRPAPPSAQKTPTMTRVTNNGKTFTGAISPDGRFVAYATMDGETQSLWVTQLATEASVRVRPASRLYYSSVAFAPGADYIYYAAADAAEPNVIDLYRLPTIGGEPEKIAADMEGQFSISPDGKRVAFRRFNALERDFVMFVASIEERTERELLRKRHPEAIGSVIWLPSGREIAYTWSQPRPGHDMKLIARDVTTGAERTIPRSEWQRVSEWRGISSLAWLPDGSGSIVAASVKRQTAQIWWAPNDGAPRKITSDVSAYSNLSVTSDGRTLVAARNEFSANIWLTPLNEGKPRALTIGAGNRFGTGGVAWAGDEILFPKVGSANPELTALRPDGTLRPVGAARTGAWQPVVSPDGSRIAFLSEIGGTVEVMITDRNGANPVQVTRAGRATSPQFFPDGTLAFVWSSRGQTLWRTSIDGSQVTQITDSPTFAPAVSRDGKWILCRLRSRDGKSPLWRTTLLTADGKVVRELPIPRFGNGPVFGWMPDGRIAYVDFKDGVANVWACELDGSGARQLTHFDSGQVYSFAVSPDGSSIALSRGDPTSDLVLIRDFRP